MTILTGLLIVTRYRLGATSRASRQLLLCYGGFQKTWQKSSLKNGPNYYELGPDVGPAHVGGREKVGCHCVQKYDLSQYSLLNIN